MKVALLYSSKKGMEAALFRRPEEDFDEETEPPPLDLLAECDSDETIKAVGRALAERHRIQYIEADGEAYVRLAEMKPDLVFNIAEGLYGPNRESHIPTICEILNIPYTGSDPLTLGICLDKSRAKEVLSWYGVANPAFAVVDDASGIPADFPIPAIVKPLYEGSGKGIRNNSVVRSRIELVDRVSEIISVYKQPVIMERFLPGREFTVGVLGNAPDYEILPIVEIDHSELPAGAEPIYSYEAKWIWDTPNDPLEIFKCPAPLDAGLKKKIETIVGRACAILRIKDWCRVDVRLDEAGEPNIIELNPLPGILPNPEENSCLPKAARTAGYSYAELINRVVDEATARCGLSGKPSAKETSAHRTGKADQA